MIETLLSGLPFQLLLALVAGVLLNLTPCVLPAIPVKIRTILHHGGASGAGRALAALLFLSGTLVFFLTLGAVTAGLHWTWGTLFQSRAVVAGLVVALGAFAFTTFWDTRVPVPGFVSRVGGGRYLEPFTSGAFVALLATPCTGPFLGGVLAFAITRPAPVVVGIFAAVGTGLALPYVLILLRPSLLNYLPKATAWSHRLRQALAFVLLAGAVFFAESLTGHAVGRWLWIGWSGLLLFWAASLWLRTNPASARALAVAVAVAGVSVVYAAGLMAPYRSGPLGWQAFSATRLEQARRAGHPVLVEFTADWCINCKVLEKTVYAKEAVAAAARREHLIALRADLTKPDPALEKRLVHYGGAGLPFAVIVNGKGSVTRRLSGLFTTQALIRAIRETEDKGKSE